MRYRGLLLLLIVTAAMPRPGAQRGERDWPPDHRRNETVDAVVVAKAVPLTDTR